MSSDYAISPLALDYYELTMLETYWTHQHSQSRAIFELFFRPHPKRPFLVSCGNESLLTLLENFHYSEEHLSQLKALGFSEAFCIQLGDWRFTGDVRMIPEGRLFFANEPLVQVIAPLYQAQLIETHLVNLMHYQVAAATKATRIKVLAQDKAVVDFGMRRAHSFDSARLAARAASIAGFAGTSNVQAAIDFGIPLSGTMAHSYVQSYTCEEEAFKDFGRVHKDRSVFLVDTYDIPSGTQSAIRATQELAKEGIHVRGVRIDSGDLITESRNVRSLLNQAGLDDLQIFVSGGIDEEDIAHLMSHQAPIDGIGVGTHFVTCSDQPFLDCAYKLVEYDNIPTLKLSPKKSFLPGQKQVYRQYGQNGTIEKDTVALARSHLSGFPLLHYAMKNGKKLSSPPTISELQQRLHDDLRSLSPNFSNLLDSQPPPLEVSRELEALAHEIEQRHRTY